MRHNVDGRKLGRTAAHRRALYKNLVISLIAHERIRTTTPKAKEARRLAERMVTFAKKGDLSARRHVASILNDKKAVQKLFDELGPRYADRAGGYTRVMRLSGLRKGDGAELALLEFVKDGDRPAKKKAKKAAPKAEKAAPKGEKEPAKAKKAAPKADKEPAKAEKAAPKAKKAAPKAGKAAAKAKDAAKDQADGHAAEKSED